MSEWRTILPTALVGTNRSALEPLPENSYLRDIQIDLEHLGDAHTILSLAGALGLHDEIGRMPPQPTIIKSNRPDPTLPLCSAETERLLSIMLGSKHLDLLDEAVRLMAVKGQRAPATVLPNLLDYGKKRPQTRPILLKVLDQNGRWLAEQNPEWSYAQRGIESFDGALDVWQGLKPSTKQSFFQQLRRSDPELGRAIMQSSWKNDQNLIRLNHIRQFKHGLSMADEAFLEMALDDRHRGIRVAAAHQLARLPNSRLAGRMAQYTAKILSIRPISRKLAVAFPADITPAMVRDGVTAHTSRKKPPLLRAEQLTQMITATNLAVWPQRLKRSPEQILKSLPTSNWPRTLLKAFTKAALYQENVEWAKAILGINGVRRDSAELITLLPRSTQIAMLRELSEKRPEAVLDKDHPLTLAFRWLPTPWPPEACAIWLDRFKKHADKQRESVAHQTYIYTMLKRFSKACPYELIEPSVSQLRLVMLIPAWKSKVAMAINILEFRQQIWAAAQKV